MGYSDFLHSFSNQISGQSKNIQEDISRLGKAKKKLQEEQSLAFNEMKQIERPELGPQWTGDHSVTFDDERAAAYEEMDRIVNHKIDDYGWEIDSKINQLTLQKGALGFASTLTDQIGDLLEVGEDAFDAIEDKFAQIRKVLF
ncbi:DUF5082 family protein [Bacillus carboniphilus]|uniref:DUF5082 family protein n=1 Tax=Bacillus carboniphilus TaxID=86663 RepID=A0ABY9JQA4_9BACI|nr:DUF5082 family protein [Bacillus carboniphilus]WLR41561.1 DUF5082 family protein [Bacillus carboniphilus]